MSKDAYYFPHDSNARNDPKIVKLLQKHGWEGYGLYWAIVEMLREEDRYELPTDYDIYAFALRSDSETIKSIIEETNLFTVNHNTFFSQSLKNRMERYEHRKKQARNAAKIRWRNDKK